MTRDFKIITWRRERRAYIGSFGGFDVCRVARLQNGYWSLSREPDRAELLVWNATSGEAMMQAHRAFNSDEGLATLAELGAIRDAGEAAGDAGEAQSAEAAAARADAEFAARQIDLVDWLATR